MLLYVVFISYAFELITLYRIEEFNKIQANVVCNALFIASVRMYCNPSCLLVCSGGPNSSETVEDRLDCNGPPI